MAVRKALVEISGQWQELPSGDTLGGAATFDGAVAFSAITTPPTITVDQNNYNPTNFEDFNVIRLSASVNIEITGIESSNVAIGQSFILVNVSTFNIKLKNNNNNSLAVNRFMLKGDLTLEKDESLIIWYDTTTLRWRVAAANI